MRSAMTFTPLRILRQHGPKVVQGSARVYRDGLTMRLSPDLIQGLSGTKSNRQRKWKFYPYVNVKEKVLKLQSHNDGTATIEIQGWFSRKNKAKSLLVSIRPIMEVMGFSVGDTPGEYKAVVVGRSIEVHFSKRLNIPS